MDDRKVRSALTELAQLVGELVEARLTAEREAAAVREREIARRMYRRGYLAGRSAQRRGAPLTTAPERHARGDLRRLLAGDGGR